MKRIISGLIAVVLVMVGSWAMAQMGGGGMMAEQGYGVMAGHLWWWVYGVVKAAAVVIGLWLLYRITKAVERIAAKP